MTDDPTQIAVERLSNDPDELRRWIEHSVDMEKELGELRNVVIYAEQQCEAGLNALRTHYGHPDADPEVLDPVGTAHGSLGCILDAIHGRNDVRQR